jgi:hypothetical protein
MISEETRVIWGGGGLEPPRPTGRFVTALDHHGYVPPTNSNKHNHLHLLIS